MLQVVCTPCRHTLQLLIQIKTQYRHPGIYLDTGFILQTLCYGAKKVGAHWQPPIGKVQRSCLSIAQRIGKSLQEYSVDRHRFDSLNQKIGIALHLPGVNVVYVIQIDLCNAQGHVTFGSRYSLFGRGILRCGKARTSIDDGQH